MNIYEAHFTLTNFDIDTVFDPDVGNNEFNLLKVFI